MSTRAIAMSLATAVVALDRVTKAMVEAWLDAYRSVTLVPGLLDLTYVQNPGGVFGVFKGLEPAWRSVLFTVVPVAAIVLIAVYAWRVPAAQTMTHVALALILGGAVGNLVDRLRLGYVVDFVDVHWRGWHWPAFNVADSAICVGVGLLLLESLRSPAPAAAEPVRRDTP